ncbi:hypothetical protein DOQ08_00168 [Marinobacter litoralis]|uniref:Gram-negative bacterial tonB protein n=1 Tax=Marinobacter litoralis TaxID=187981 RepID=A0A3M2RJU0_9GAMM|nr:TonB family protein [Marinobacter litoralis]RMJ05498.1 hypothetical protein DOQ08_00168 [Marinobacter litoralis]
MLQSDSGPAKSVPASYRIGLALSLALMSHILLLAGMPSPLLEAQDLSHRLVFTLNATSSQPGVHAAPDSASQEPLRHSEFSVEPKKPVIKANSPENPVAAKQPKPTSTPQRQEARQQAAKAQPGLAAAQSATTRSPKQESKETIQRIAKSPTEQDPYLVKLAVHLAEELEKMKVPAISQLDTTKEMTLELRILANGALTLARVKESTGIDTIDRAAYRAALSASPYPKPEGEKSDRFDVKLMFTPKRPER